MNQLRELIRKAYDLHVHIGPEIIPRSYTAQTLVQEETGSIAGMALKNHFFPTTPFSAVYTSKSLKLIGSIVLNNFVGGLNADAVYAASTIANGPFIVWFPTVSAQQFLDESEWEIAPEWVGSNTIPVRRSKTISGISVTDKSFTLSDSTISVLNAIQSTKSILATGHISWEESKILVKKAYEMGIKKIIITHPLYQKISMSLEIQRELIGFGAKIEHCFSMYSIDKISISRIAEEIKQIGPNNCILSSDVGQTFSPSPSKALYEFATLLMKEGILLKEIEIMLVNNPKTLLT